MILPSVALAATGKISSRRCCTPPELKPPARCCSIPRLPSRTRRCDARPILLLQPLTNPCRTSRYTARRCKHRLVGANISTTVLGRKTVASAQVVSASYLLYADVRTYSRSANEVSPQPPHTMIPNIYTDTDGRVSIYLECVRYYEKVG